MDHYDNRRNSNKKIDAILGIARLAVRARNVGRDIFAAFKNIAGGEIEDIQDYKHQSKNKLCEE